MRTRASAGLMAFGPRPFLASCPRAGAVPPVCCSAGRTLLSGPASAQSTAAAGRDSNSAPTPGLDSAPDSEPGLIARAKSLFERGATAYSAGRYFEAIESFTEANDLYPNPQFSFNIAKAYDNLGSHSGALRYYLEYLRRSPEALDRVATEAAP